MLSTRKMYFSVLELRVHRSSHTTRVRQWEAVPLRKYLTA